MMAPTAEGSARYRTAFRLYSVVFESASHLFTRDRGDFTGGQGRLKLSECRKFGFRGGQRLTLRHGCIWRNIPVEKEAPVDRVCSEGAVAGGGHVECLRGPRQVLSS